MAALYVQCYTQPSLIGASALPVQLYVATIESSSSWPHQTAALAAVATAAAPHVHVAETDGCSGSRCCKATVVQQLLKLAVL